MPRLRKHLSVSPNETVVFVKYKDKSRNAVEHDFIEGRPTRNRIGASIRLVCRVFRVVVTKVLVRIGSLGRRCLHCGGETGATIVSRCGVPETYY
jgi:hypothetical protein